MSSTTNITVGIQSENSFVLKRDGTKLVIGQIIGSITIEHTEAGSKNDLGIEKLVESCTVKFAMSPDTVEKLCMDEGKTLIIDVRGPGKGIRRYTFWKAKALSIPKPDVSADIVSVDCEFNIEADDTKCLGQRLGIIEDV